MNIFIVDKDPAKAAQMLPDRHVVKMILETCQMLSVIYSPWYHNWGVLHKKDGTFYATEKGAFRNHPCTKWAAENHYNLAWLISHGIGLCFEYTERYSKFHSCQETIGEAMAIFHSCSNGVAVSDYKQVNNFVRAMPDEYKLDTSIDDVTAYRMYVASKPWVSSNYLRKPERKPDWVQ
jgi:hypothetical protein